MKTFHVTRNVKLRFLALLLLTLLGLGLLVYIPFRLFSAISDLGDVFGNATSPLPLISSLICSTPLLLALIATVWMGIYSVAVYRTRLIFDDHSLKLESLRRFTFILWGSGLKPFMIPYDQIEAIRSVGLTATVHIFDTNGKKYALAPALFGKKYGEEVLIELQNRLPSNRIESGMEIPDMVRNWAKGNKVRIAIVVSFLVAYTISLPFDPMFSSRSWFIDAWHVEMRPLGFESVWTRTVDSSNGFWVVAWKTDKYRVYHFSDTFDNEHTLPKSLLGKRYPQLVSADKNGNPIVWMENSVFHFENGNWNTITYDENLDLGDWDSRGVVSNAQGWAIEKDERNKRVLKIDALSGKWSTIPLPPTAEQEKLFPVSMHRAVNNDILVLMQNDANARVYLLSEDKWKSQEYPVILMEQSRVIDYFLDGGDFLWVLLNSQKQFYVERIHPNGNLDITRLPSPRETDEWERYTNILVDSSGRLWVSGSYPYFMAVFSPVWETDSSEIIRYTEDNSNYQGDGSPILLPDGSIWVLDRMITSMDSNSENLPAPLPAWFADLDWNLIRLYIILPQFLFSIYMFIISLVRLKSPKKRAPK